MTPVKKKLLHLQGLRGIAILAVIAFHFFPKYCNNGYLGVDMFFLLSGYLMTMMLDRIKSFSTSEIFDFWYRRFKRILPYYYLVIFGIIAILFGMEGTVQSANVDSAFNAVILAINLIRPSGDAGYFEKLGIAVDMFTHTWSLALEMQFYFLFPFIFLLIKRLPSHLRPYATLFIAVMSFSYHIFTDEFNSFNSVFSRIWQFLAGTAAFYADDWFSKRNSLESDEEEDEVLLENTEESHQPHPVLINTFLFALLVLFVIQQTVDPLYARINSILISFVIVAYGKNCCLENRLLVFIGEISYGWYLVHWPVYALLKIHELTDNTHLFGGVILSLLLAVILHYAFEKHYLAWSKITVISVVGFLLIFNASAIIYMKSLVETVDEPLPSSSNTSIPFRVPNNLDPRFFFPSDFLDNIVYGFENKTVAERIALNNQYNSGDGERSHAYCKNWIKTHISTEWRCEMNYMVNKTVNNTFLLLGNSWAGNIMQPVAESCSHRFSHMEVVYQSGCEALFPSFRHDSYECELDYMFLDAVKRVKPDVLMLVQRYSDSQKLLNGTSPLNDFTYKEGIRRLKEYEKYVKKKILIVDAFPWPKNNIISRMNEKLAGKKIPDQDDVEFDKRYLTVKQRIARVISGCKKCQVFDFSNQFWFDGQFKLYEPKYFVSFMTSALHLTPAGWIRVKPLRKYVCDTV